MLCKAETSEPGATAEEQLELLNKSLQELEAKMEVNKQTSTKLVNSTRTLQDSLRTRYNSIREDEEVVRVQEHIAQLEQQLLAAREELNALVNNDDDYKDLADQQKVYSAQLGEIRKTQYDLGQQRSKLIGQIAAVKRQMTLRAKARTENLKQNAESKENTQ